MMRKFTLFPQGKVEMKKFAVLVPLLLVCACTVASPNSQADDEKMLRSYGIDYVGAERIDNGAKLQFVFGGAQNCTGVLYYKVSRPGGTPVPVVKILDRKENELASFTGDELSTIKGDSRLKDC